MSDQVHIVIGIPNQTPTVFEDFSAAREYAKQWDNTKILNRTPIDTETARKDGLID